MDDKQVRNFGLIASAGAFAIALGVANFGGEHVVTPASVQAENVIPPVEFMVRFKAGHPLAAAQTLMEQGKAEQAEKAARAALKKNAALKGLCFSSFTLGGSEVVLTPCKATPDSERAALSAKWTEKLRAQSGVEYADSNMVAVTQTPQE